MQLSSSDERRYNLWMVITTAVAFVCFVAVALTVLPDDRSESRIANLHYLLDKNDQETFATILHRKASDWRAVDNPVNLGMQHIAHWFRFSIPPTASPTDNYLLEISYPLLDQLDIAVFQKDSLTPTVVFQSGDEKPFSERPVAHRTFLFPLPDSVEPQEVYIRVLASGTIRLPLKVWQEREFIEHTPRLNLIMGLFFGFLCAMGVSNLFLFLTTRSGSFIAYSGYVFTMALTLASLHGFGYAYLWPDVPLFQEKAIVIFANLTIVFAIQFARLLLPVKEYWPRMDRIMKYAIGVFLINIVLGLFLTYAILIKVFMVLLSMAVLMVLGVGSWLAIKGVVVARYFSIAWAFLLISGLTASLDNLNLIGLTISSNYLVMLGAAIEMLLLALVVAISYSHTRSEMFDAQEKALSQEKDANRAKEDLLAVQKRYQSDLEYQVGERTLELEIALRELSEANRELEELNAIDSLTGIKNRRHFDKRLKAEGRRSRREQTPLSLAMVDVDHFKRINDHFGHAAGDACIQHVANVLQKRLKRPSDDVCRVGGEEFALILPNTSLEGAVALVESMRQTLQSSPVVFEEHSIDMTLSAGIATAVIAQEEQELDVLKEADRQLYNAKQAGRNQTQATDLTTE